MKEQHEYIPKYLGSSTLGNWKEFRKANEFLNQDPRYKLPELPAMVTSSSRDLAKDSTVKALIRFLKSDSSKAWSAEDIIALMESQGHSPTEKRTIQRSCYGLPHLMYDLYDAGFLEFDSFANPAVEERESVMIG